MPLTFTLSLCPSLSPLSLSLLFALSPPISLSFSLSYYLPFLILIICVCCTFYKKSVTYSVTPIFWTYFFLTHSFISLIIYLFPLYCVSMDVFHPCFTTNQQFCYFIFSSQHTLVFNNLYKNKTRNMSNYWVWYNS